MTQQLLYTNDDNWATWFGETTPQIPRVNMNTWTIQVRMSIILYIYSVVAVDIINLSKNRSFATNGM